MTKAELIEALEGYSDDTPICFASSMQPSDHEVETGDPFVFPYEIDFIHGYVGNYINPDGDELNGNMIILHA